MKKIIWTILFITLESAAFSNLKKAEEYALKKLEYPDSDNQDWLAPDYTSFIKSQKPSYFNKILKLLKRESEYWSPKAFNKKILEITKMNEKQQRVVELEITNDEKFVIFGALGGAYHSLVRDLKELERKQIINNNFEIVSKNTYIIFLGNAVGTSPYNMETIFLISDLLQKNNGKIFYLEGAEEYREFWADRTFGKEIAIKGIAPSLKKESLKYLIKNFFNTLPKAVILNLPKYKESIIISYLTNPTEVKINPKYDIKLELHSDAPKTEFSENGIIIKSENNKKIVNILSSPTRTNRYLYSISNDNFAILDIKNGKYDIFQICGKKASFKNDFICKRLDQLEEKKVAKKTKQEDVPKEKEDNQIYIASGEKILFGSTSDITKSNNIIAIPVKQGLSLRMNNQNRLGGVNGKLLQIVFLDDQYTPQIARKNIEQLIKDYKTNLILAPIGTPTLAASLDLIKDKKILVLFSNSGAPLFRNKNLTNIISFRVSYTDEAKVLIDYMYKNYTPKRIAFFYQNDEYGNFPLEASIEKLTQMGVDENNILKIPYSRNDVNIQAAIKKIIEFGPDMIGFYALPFVGGELIRQMGPGKLANIKLFGISPMGEDGFRNLLNTTGLKMIISNAVPNPNSTELEITRQYQKDAKAQGISNYSNVYTLEGYIDMCLTIEILKKIKTNIDVASIIKSAENIRNINFLGLNLNFNPKNRQLNNSLWLDIGDPEWLEVKVSSEN